MKLSVHHKGNVYIIPCGQGEKTIRWLLEETIKRSKILHGETNISTGKLEARLQQTHGLLMEDDLICEVLDDNALVYIGKFRT